MREIEETQRQPVLCVRDLTTAFRVGGVWKTVVDRINFEIGEKETLAVVGESGSGKSVTALSIMRLVSAINGRVQGYITLEGRSLLDLAEEEMLTVRGGSIGMIFQDFKLLNKRTVFENVAFGLRRLGKNRSEIEQKTNYVLKLVQMEEFSKRRPNQLSGGQQQRVALARALAPEPKVLLLDEPLSALDLKLRQAMRIELKTLQRETGITFVFVTHDQEEALTMSDRIAVISEGEIQQIGEPNSIYENPANQFVANFIGEANLLKGICKNVGKNGLCKLNSGHEISLEIPSLIKVNIGSV